jgi:hypothetical protein
MVGESTEAVGAGVGGGSTGQKMPTLEEYGTNLTKLAEEVFLSLLCLFICYWLVKPNEVSSFFCRVNWIRLLEERIKLSAWLRFWEGGQRTTLAWLESLVLARPLLLRGLLNVFPMGMFQKQLKERRFVYKILGFIFLSLLGNCWNAFSGLLGSVLIYDIIKVRKKKLNLFAKYNLY